MAAATPALGLTEARIIRVSCAGLTVIQHGLPPGKLFEVTASNAARGKILIERKARSSARGDLSVRLRTDLHGVRRLHAEVERLHVRNSEYGEADVDLNRRCQIVGQAPASPAPAPAPSADVTTAPVGSDSSSHWLVWAGLGAVIGLAGAAGCGLAVRRRRTMSA